ncbi:hypothetical protein KZ813_07905 [Sphingomonas sp. RHCKR7]|uniref:hypothetical protein n=1 Tax=Sphingomonas folli TaxID=2862497 RepID=UPI001CA5E71C|nr:hypothetical protein [Sphingomonas folli]MBW6526758.1 hypothetical protein [Sphingomonas folli]
MSGLLLVLAAMAQSPAPAAPDEASAPPVAAPAGQRQSRDDQLLHIAPMSRLSTRIDNRLQTRIQNRIAGSQSDLAAAYKAATDQSQRSR